MRACPPAEEAAKHMMMRDDCLSVHGHNARTKKAKEALCKQATGSVDSVREQRPPGGRAPA